MEEKIKEKIKITISILIFLPLIYMLILLSINLIDINQYNYTKYGFLGILLFKADYLVSLFFTLIFCYYIIKNLNDEKLFTTKFIIYIFNLFFNLNEIIPKNEVKSEITKQEIEELTEEEISLYKKRFLIINGVIFGIYFVLIFCYYLIYSPSNLLNDDVLIYLLILFLVMILHLFLNILISIIFLFFKKYREFAKRILLISIVLFLLILLIGFGTCFGIIYYFGF